jgi:DNA-directed RNA polymerase subunit RPC12/RpoP
MIHFRCPDCHASVRGPDGLAGRSVSCPKCTSRVSILVSHGVPLAAKLDSWARPPGPAFLLARNPIASAVVLLLVGMIVGLAVGWSLNRSSAGSDALPAAAKMASVQLELAKLYLARNRADDAKLQLQQLLAEHPGSPESPEATQLLKELADKQLTAAANEAARSDGTN